MKMGDKFLNNDQSRQMLKKFLFRERITKAARKPVLPIGKASMNGNKADIKGITYIRAGI